MTKLYDELIRNALAPFAHEVDDGDWREVVGRANTLRRRRALALGAAAAAVVSLGATAAFSLGHPVIDFFGAEKGPRSVVVQFGQLDVGAPEGMAPQVDAEQARKITEVTFSDGKRHILWLGPTKAGGFCESWTGLWGGCRADRNHPFSRHLGITGSDGPNGATALGGSFFQEEGDKVEVEFADGAKEEIPFVWVSEPINAGFFLYEVPQEHRVLTRRAVAVSLFDHHGRLITRERVAHTPPPQFEIHHVQGFPPLDVPPRAIYAERRMLFDFRAENGDRVGLWVAPEEGGGTCYWTTREGGCDDGRRPSLPPLALVHLVPGARPITVCCAVGQGVVRIVLQFEDGDRIVAVPREGFVLVEVPERHYAIGHRLHRIVGLDERGKEIGSQELKTDTPAVYPCEKPRTYAYGAKMCP